MENSSKVATLSPSEVEALRTQPNVVVIDVRMPFIYLGGRIPNSVNMPGKAFIARKAQVPAGLQIIFVDDDGTDFHAAEDALGAGYAKVAVLEGGYDAWLAADLPTETASEGVMPGITAVTPTQT